MSREYRKAYRRVKYDYKMLTWSRGKRRGAERELDTCKSQEADYRTKWEDSLIELGDIAIREDKIKTQVEETMTRERTVTRGK